MLCKNRVRNGEIFHNRGSMLAVQTFQVTARIPVAVPDKIFGLTLILDFIDRGHSLWSLFPPLAALPSLPSSVSPCGLPPSPRGKVLIRRLCRHLNCQLSIQARPRGDTKRKPPGANPGGLPYSEKDVGKFILPIAHLILFISNALAFLIPPGLFPRGFPYLETLIGKIMD